MPRELKVPTRERGPLSLFLIHADKEGRWEREWEPLQNTSLASMIPVVTQGDVDAAVRGWSRPLVDKLSLAPAHVLIKLPGECAKCSLWEGCLLRDGKRCFPRHPKMPNCFRPGEMEAEIAGFLGYLVLSYWRAGVYVLVAKEISDAGPERDGARVR